MSGAGSPELEIDGTGLKVTIVAGRWHEYITDGLLAGARRVLAASGAEVSEVRVPGSFELPVVSLAALEAGADAVVALGVIIRGGTPHFEYVSQGVTNGLTQVAVETGVPVGFGILTCDNEEQALDRAGLPGSNEDKGHEAVTAAVATAAILRSVSEPWR